MGSFAATPQPPPAAPLTAPAAPQELLQQTGTSDLSPGLESISVSFAKALLKSPALLTSVAAKEVSREGGNFTAALASAYKRLGLEEEAPLEITTCESQKLEGLLRGALERYLEKQGENAELCSEATMLTFIAISADIVDSMPLCDTSTVADAKEFLSRSSGRPYNFFKLISSTGIPAVQSNQLLREIFPDLVATIIVSPPVFEPGDRVRGHWSSHSTSSGSSMAENWYCGDVREVMENDDGSRNYLIYWEDRTKSDVKLEGAVWRTAYGGVIYAIEKEQ